MSRKSRFAKLSIASNILLIAMKVAVGLSTGAVSIVSEAIHSAVDLAAAVIAFFSVKFADMPPDRDHPYGHEKMENVSGVVETVLIFAASAFIIKEAIHKLIHRTEVEGIGLGCIVMLISAVVNFFVSRKLYAVARQEGSVALEADALHLKVDVYTSAGVGLGLLVLWLTGLHFLDPLIALLIAVLILKEAFDMLRTSFGPLIDTRLPDNELAAVEGIIDRHRGILIDSHELRTRRSGNVRHIDLHITVPQTMSVKECHDLCDRIEHDIEADIRNTKVLIHAEPCDETCGDCRFSKNSLEKGGRCG